MRNYLKGFSRSAILDFTKHNKQKETERLEESSQHVGS